MDAPTTSHEAAQAAIGHAVHHGHGLFDIATVDFWYSVSFLLFLVLLGRPILKMAGKMLDDRTEEISRQLEEARALREDAQNLLSTYKKKQREAVEEADEILNAAKAEAKMLKSEAKKELDQSLKARENQAVQKIKLAEKNALSEVQAAAADIAIAATRKLIEDKLTEASLASITDTAIGTIPKKMAG